MANLSKIKREKMLTFLKSLREINCNDDDALKAINEIESAICEKRYGLIWEEHDEDVDNNLINNVPVFTEDFSKEVNEYGTNTFNFLLEGDNLHSLYLLEKTHKEKIGAIYIDPPYNTGKEDFKYNDKYVDDLDLYRHSKWLSFMNRRLLIAKKLLSEDGVIFISIDDNEYAPLKLLCDEIFGVENCLSIHHIQVRYSNKSLNERKDFQECLEYVLIYAKNHDKFAANRPVTEYSLEPFKFVITENVKTERVNIAGKEVEIFKAGEWSIIDKGGDINNLKETWVTGSIYSGTGHGLVYQKIVEPRLKEDGYGCLYKVFGLGEDGLGYRYFTGPQKAGATKGKMFTGVPLTKREEIEKGTAVKLGTISNFYDYSPDFGNIRSEGGVAFNSGKKPIKLIKQLLSYIKRKDITVLDFFAGSGSTGHAVLSLNQEDNGTRKFILCTNNENNICEEVTYKRLVNVIRGYSSHEGIKANLKYYKTDFIDKADEEFGITLMNHIKEMIQLEFGIKIDNKKYVIILSDDEIDTFEKTIVGDYYPSEIFISRDVLLTTEQKKKLRKTNIHIIPDYYFDFELREVGESW